MSSRMLGVVACACFLLWLFLSPDCTIPLRSTDIIDAFPSLSTQYESTIFDDTRDDARTGLRGAFSKSATESKVDFPFVRKFYRPIVLIHGINNHPRDWDKFIKAVKSVRPENELFELVSPFDGVPLSWVALSVQVSWFTKEIRNLILSHPSIFNDGLDLVCHSQGAVACRAIIHEHGGNKIRSFVSLAGPQMGVFGSGWIDFFPPHLRNMTIHDAYKIAYEDWAQASLSPANLWHDPYHEPLYREKNVFLPKYAGMSTRSSAKGGDEHNKSPEAARRKRNFLNLERAAFLVGNFSKTTFDQGIDPWNSGIFGFYDANGEMVEGRKQEVYLKDTFGLRTLDETGRLTLLAVPNVLHDDWIYNKEIIVKYVVPHLSPNIPKNRFLPDGDFDERVE